MNFHALLLSFLLQLQQLCRLQVYHLRFIVGLIDPDKLIGQIEHIIPKRDNYELRIFSPFFYVLSHHRNILKVEGCIDFVHKVQRSRFVVVKSEN